MKGKAEPVAAYRLLAVRRRAGAVATARASSAATRELALLREAWERAVESGAASW